MTVSLHLKLAPHKKKKRNIKTNTTTIIT